MKIAIIVTSNEAETVWNAFRFGVFALKKGDTVQTFLLGKGVESERIDSQRFNVTEQMQQFVGAGGVISACGTCLKLRDAEGSDLCPVSTMSDLHAIVSEADKVLTF